MCANGIRVKPNNKFPLEIKSQQGIRLMIFNLISFFSGFLTSSIIDTSLGEFNEWAIVGASLVVANIESFNNFYFSILSKNKSTLISKAYIVVLFDILNFFKIGIVYGLIVDAFKLGS